MGYGHEEYSGFKRQDHSDEEGERTRVQGRIVFGRDGREH